MNLTILGNNGPYPSAGGACSGYLIREGDINLLIDCGNGVLSNLQKFIPLEGINAIILTHLHSDHMSDMMVLRYAIQVKNKKGALIPPVSVYAPDEPEEEFKSLDISGVYRLSALNDDTVLNIGGLKLTFRQMKHPFKCYAISIDNGNKRFVFSGDTAMCEDIIDFARGSDVLMLDSGLLSREKTGEENVVHLTAEECGIIAKNSGTKKLLLTHFWTEHNKAELLNEAKKNFDNTWLAELMNVYEI